MRDVAIFGAGTLGGQLAHLLARGEVSTLVRLIEPVGGRAQPSSIAIGKALDIQQASAVERFATPVIGSSEPTDAANAAVIVVADSVSGEFGTDESLALLRRVRQTGSDAMIVCAGASHRELVERAVRELRVPKERIVGTAPEALASAVRAFVALEVDGSVHGISLSLLGIPPTQLVLAWEGASIGGAAATRVLDEPARRRLSERAARAWPPGPHTLATAASVAVGAYLNDTAHLMSCFVGPDDSSGARTRAAALPTRIGGSGARVVDLEDLSPRERTAVDSALLL